MDSHMVAVEWSGAEMRTALHHRNDPQCHLTDAEIMTVAIVAALFFGGKYAPAQAPLADHPSIAAPLNASRFSRRVHRIKALFLTRVCRQ